MFMKPTEITNYFQKLSIEDLRKIPDIGPAVAESIYNWFRDKHNLALLEKLEMAGIKIEVPKFSASSLKLQGKTFVLTGEMESLSREQAKERIRELGGDVSSSVSKNTDFTVVGKNPGSKYDKAKKLDVKIIGEKEFLKMVE
jgi:DNA ligase (NAD+)